jgi:hypothetical protein
MRPEIFMSLTTAPIESVNTAPLPERFWGGLARSVHLPQEGPVAALEHPWALSLPAGARVELPPRELEMGC